MPAHARRLDTASTIVILATVILFLVALFEKGLTHDLLLEAGVFLVSTKIVLMSAKQALSQEATHARLDQIEATLGRIERVVGPNSTGAR